MRPTNVEYLLTYVYSQQLGYGGDRAYAGSGHVFICTRSLREASMSGCMLSQPMWNTYMYELVSRACIYPASTVSELLTV